RRSTASPAKAWPSSTTRSGVARPTADGAPTRTSDPAPVASGRLAANRPHRAPRPDGELQVELDLGVAEVVARDLADPPQAVLERAAMHGERARRGVVGAAALEGLRQRHDQLRGALLVVVAQQVAEPSLHEPFDQRKVVDAGEQPVHAEVVEDDGLIAAVGRRLHSQGQQRLAVRPWEVDDLLAHAANPDLAPRAVEL